MPHKTLIYLAIIAYSQVSNASDCIPTAHHTTGTHYQPVTQQKTNISKGVTVKGKILAMPDCKPVANAKVAHWQAGEDGTYQDRLRAYLFTDAEGNYQFETEWPNITPPHIHFIISTKGYQVLETQWIGRQRSKEINFNIILEK